MTTKGKRIALILGVCGVLIAAAFAVTNDRLAVGTIDSYAPFGGPARVTMGHTTMQPGEDNGWHSHPGQVTVVVTSGTLTFEEGCGGVQAYNAGQAFTEASTDIHRAVNRGTVPLEFYATVIVPSAMPNRISYPGPLCGPPANKDACKQDGWSKFDFPRTFANQGDCESFVETGN